MISLEFEELLWLFVLVVSLHMVEELIWLPAWSQDAGRWHEPVDRKSFAFATGTLLLFLYTITYLAANAPAESVTVYLVCGLALVMLVNIVLPHLGATIAQRRYAPGLGTSLILILPVAILLNWRAFTDDLISMPRYALAAASILLATAVIWPALFRIGKRLVG